MIKISSKLLNLNVYVIPNSKKEKIIVNKDIEMILKDKSSQKNKKSEIQSIETKNKKRDCEFIIYTTEKAVENKANISVIKALKKYFHKNNIKIKKIYIKSGLTSRNKSISIELE